MFEIASTTRTRNAYARAHAERGAALGRFLRSILPVRK